MMLTSMSRPWNGLRDAIAAKKGGGFKSPDLDPGLRKRTIFNDVRDLLNNTEVKRVIKIGSDIANAIQPFMEKRTLWQGLKAGFMIGQSLVENFTVYSHDFFDDDIWVEPYNKDFTGAILKVIKKFPYETIKTSTEGYVIHLVHLNGARIGWSVNSKLSLNKVERLYTEAHKVDQVRKDIKNLLWEQYKGKPLVLKRNQTYVSYDEDKVSFEVDDAFHPLPSARATEYSKYLQRCLDAGVNRSVMLYGPPGTGKSTMARTLVHTLGLRSFRIRIEDMSSVNSSTLFEAIRVFEPEAIILDDFDRAGGQESLLEVLEHFLRHIKLIVATVNRRQNLDEALLRPGRFDELLLVKQMDEDVVRAVLGEENVDAFDIVKNWPVAFIQEFVKRRRFMSKEEAADTTKELAQRVQRLEAYDDDDDDLVRVVGTETPRRRRGVQLAKRKIVHDDDDMLALLQEQGLTIVPDDDDDEE